MPSQAGVSKVHNELLYVILRSLQRMNLPKNMSTAKRNSWILKLEKQMKEEVNPRSATRWIQLRYSEARVVYKVMAFANLEIRMYQIVFRIEAEARAITVGLRRNVFGMTVELRKWRDWWLAVRYGRWPVISQAEFSI
jgi:hypothetical protein